MTQDRFYMLVLILVMLFPVPVVADQLAVEVAKEQIDVTVGFDGSSVELFGNRRDKDSDVLIVIQGPKKDITIWEKKRVMGTWVNRYFVTYYDMPVYYHYASSLSGKVTDNVDMIMRHNGVGHDSLFSSLRIKKSESLKGTQKFEQDLLKKKQEHGVYFSKPADIKFINDHFFRVRFEIPASAQTGEYVIRSLLIKEGQIITEHKTKLWVKQVGINAFLNHAATQHSFAYAFACIFLALFFGWFSSVVKVRP